MLGQMFLQAKNHINTPARLSGLIDMIGRETWSGLNTDLKGNIYEELLAKTAEDKAALEKLKAAGFNCIRFHTHAPVPEYFEAADEAGIMIQPELSYYMDDPDDAFGYDPVRDALERWVAFRRHPSYAINSCGNEGLVGPGAGRIL